MKVGSIIGPEVRASLTKVFKSDLKRDVAQKVKRLVIMIESEISKYDNLRNALIEELCVKDDAGAPKMDGAGNVEFTQEGRQEFFKRESELKNMDVLIQPMKQSELGDITLSAEDLFVLDAIFKE